MNIELRSEARRDLVDAAVFFDSQRDGLGNYFVDCIFRDLKSLEVESVGLVFTPSILTQTTIVLPSSSVDTPNTM